MTAEAAAPADCSLGKHEELSTVTPIQCVCGPRFLRLRSDAGELVRPRGRSVNRCEYCAKLAAVENCEMLVLDALDGDVPQLIAILGTRTATVDMSAFARAREFMVRAVRRRWPDAQYAYEVEFTTGYGPRSGGKRRPHWNWFWKGIPRQELDEARAIIVAIWCEHVDAVAEAQYVAEIDNAIGLTKYVTEHFMKESQRPPFGFTGQRFCASRGYFRGSVATARARARESLRRKRELHRHLEAGWGAQAAHDLAERAYCEQRRRVWVLTNDRGRRVGDMQHDGRRMALPSDRRTDAEMRSRSRALCPMATASGVAVGAARRARARANAQTVRSGRPKPTSPATDLLRMSTMQLPLLSGTGPKGIKWFP